MGMARHPAHPSKVTFHFGVEIMGTIAVSVRITNVTAEPNLCSASLRCSQPGDELGDQEHDKQDDSYCQGRQDRKTSARGKRDQEVCLCRCGTQQPCRQPVIAGCQ